MSKSVSCTKKEIEKKKQAKRLEKQKRKEERRANGGSTSFEDMIAYVDENGMITDTPPDLSAKQEVEIEDIEISTPKMEEGEEENGLTGSVEFFNAEKGYGFIKSLDKTDKYFFHISNAPAAIKEGDKVTFELERGKRGMNAVKISLVK